MDMLVNRRETMRAILRDVFDGNVSRMAVETGIGRTTLHNIFREGADAPISKSTWGRVAPWLAGHEVSMIPVRAESAVAEESEPYGGLSGMRPCPLSAACPVSLGMADSLGRVLASPLTPAQVRALDKLAEAGAELIAATKQSARSRGDDERE